MPTLTRMLSASVITSLFVGAMFFILTIITFLFGSFSLDAILPAVVLSMYAVIVSLIIILLLGIPMVIFLIFIKKLNWKYISALSFILGFGIFYLLLNGSLFYSRPIEFYSYLFIILILGFPVVALLKKFNKFNWKYILSYSFIIGFILMSLLLQVWRYDTIFDIIRSSLLHCIIVGVASMITGAIFYKKLSLLEKK